MATKQEVKETTIEVLTDEQLKQLPQEVQTIVVKLDANLPPKELSVLNPLMLELFKIKEFESLIYIPMVESEDKKIAKENKKIFDEHISKFKEALKSISDFKKKSAEAKKAIKGPLDELGKDIISLERSVNATADETLAVLEKNFEIFIKETKAKALELKTKREEAATAEVNKLTEESKEKSATIIKSNLITFLKFEMLEGTKEDAMLARDSFTLEKLHEFKAGIKDRTFEDYAKGQDLSILENSELELIKLKFRNEFNDIINNIDTKIIALEALKDNTALVNTLEVIEETQEAVANAIAQTPNQSFTARTASGEMYSGSQAASEPIPLFEGGLIPEVEKILIVTAEKIRRVEESFRAVKGESITEEESIIAKRTRSSIILLGKTLDYIKLGNPAKENQQPNN